MPHCADPAPRRNSALLYQIGGAFSILAGVFVELPFGAVILIVLVDVGFHVGRSQDNIREPKTWGK